MTAQNAAEVFGDPVPAWPIPARPVPPLRTPGLSAALLRPHLLANLIASYPDHWYDADFSDFRVGIASAARGVLVNEPETIRHILVTNAANYPKDDNQLAILKPLLGQGLLTADGDVWRRNRKLAAPIFQHSSVREFAPLFVAAAERSVRRLLESGKPFAIDHEMTRLTLDIIGSSVLGADIGDDFDGIAHSVTSTLDKFPAMFLAGAFLPPWARDGFIDRLVKPGRRGLDIFARRIIEAAKHKEHDDTLLSRLMVASRADSGQEMSVDQVRDEVATFLLAGHETTANTLTWAWYLLTLHPEAMRRVQSEVDEVAGAQSLTADDASALPYTRAVIDEALRLYPPVANIMRMTSEDDETPAGVKLPAGQRILISPWLMHRHRRHWRKPDRFDPSRFLGDDARTTPRYAYLPFGGGPRFCIGASFAVLEAVLILATFARRAHIRVLNAANVMPQARLVLRPNVSLRAAALPRTGR
jgi:cytochrome P450